MHEKLYQIYVEKNKLSKWNKRSENLLWKKSSLIGLDKVEYQTNLTIFLTSKLTNLST